MINAQIIKDIYPEPFQWEFLQTKERYPAMISGWGTGKTMFGIMKCLQLCNDYHNNRGIIFRREFTDLRDSTMSDFEEYTGIKINQQKNEAKIPGTGSSILFRHAKDLDTAIKQNVNLGFFMIEQADEIESDETFFTLFGRLRRGKFQQGIIIANATDENHWLFTHWKRPHLEGKPKPQFPLWEATTFDNKKNLPKGFLESLEITKKEKPAIYDRYVLNSWNVGEDRFVLIPAEKLVELKGVPLIHQYEKNIISCDPSLGGDECVIQRLTNYAIKQQDLLQERDLMKIVAHLMLIGEMNGIKNYSIDTIGIGKGVGDRLHELKKKVQYIGSSEKANDQLAFTNRRAEMWWYLAQLVIDRKIPYPEDEVLRRQLSSVRYKVVDSNGKIGLELKKETKKRLGQSPDRADCYVYGVWGTQFVDKEKMKDPYENWEEKMPLGSYMAS